MTTKKNLRGTDDFTLELRYIQTDVLAKPLPRERKYVLKEDFKLGSLTIPKGFKWDGASIPRVFWSVIGSPFSPDLMRASLIHDFLYRRKDVRAKCTDVTFYKVLLADGVSKLRAYIMYKSVRGYRFLK